MISIDAFFRTHYRSMCNYCAAQGFNAQDVEEEVVDVMLHYFGEYVSRCNDPKVVRRWMSRRVMWDLKSKYKNRKRYTLEFPSDVLPEISHFDTPEEILSLKQRVPDQVHPILISYQQYGGEHGVKGANDPNDKVTFCRQRKKFLNLLDSE